ncbi:hypothetical protein EVAR_40631_1 [Eumeta japonica]|uniref:Uncharacterized protein n=1 Tax=Eumeta variegata TaxID=151549 RepID=A0A4C1X6U2_EUMVA|nr:hypothetical protein EVAR_40631_1 [Eumeta japonica]
MPVLFSHLEKLKSSRGVRALPSHRKGRTKRGPVAIRNCADEAFGGGAARAQARTVRPIKDVPISGPRGLSGDERPPEPPPISSPARRRCCCSFPSIVHGISA